MQASNRRYTFLGLGAIVLWSTTIAFSRSLTEQLGTFTAAALIYVLAGLFGLLVAWLQGGLGGLRRLPRLYLFGCGALFVIYIVALYVAVGLAANRVQVIVVGLINYLWPGLSLVFSIPVLGKRGKPWLPLGIALALAGVWLASTSGGDVSLSGGLPSGMLLPAVTALIAAVAWGLYSTLSRRWAGGSEEAGAVPLFLLVSGLVLALMRLFVVEQSVWTVGAGAGLLYMALFPGMLAYVLWDVAVRRGELVFVASLSYLTPLLSTLFSSLILNVQPGASVWVGAGLVIVGAVVCKVSVVENSSGEGQIR